MERLNEELNYRVAVERIAPVDEALRSAHPDDIEAVEGVSIPQRKAEILAWRGLVRRMVGGTITIQYNALGAPTVSGAQGCEISVSHTLDRVAVVVSHMRCGVDIERLDRAFGRVASRYISPAERALGGAVDHFEAVAWCIKEALYKYSCRRELDFIADIEIVQIDPLRGRATCRVGAEEGVVCHYSIEGELCLAVAT